MTKNWILVLLLCGCIPGAPAKPLVGDPSCETACARLLELGCEAAQSSDGLSCVDLCTDFMDQGAPYPLRCVSEAGSCASADAC